jgi:hypothetical protein
MGPLLRGVEVTEIARMRHSPQVNSEPGEALSHFANALREGTRDDICAATVVCRAEGLWQPTRASRKHCVRVSCLSVLHQPDKKFSGDSRHVAGHNQVPLGLCAGKSCVDARKGATPSEDIRQNGITKVSVPVGVSDQSYVTCRGARFGCNVFYERASMKREQGFVAAHAGTLSTRQHKGRPFHAEMITLRGCGDVSRVTEK